MSLSTKLHEDEVDITVKIAGQLVKEQFPELSDLPITLSSNSGTNNVIFRLGSDKCLRIPRTKEAEAHLRVEADWLPQLAPRISLEIPRVIDRGVPSKKYPYQWAIYSWIEGSLPSEDVSLDRNEIAKDLAQFINELHSARLNGSIKARRGVPIRSRDREVRAIWSAVENLVDVPSCKKIWQKVLEAGDWQKGPVWLHGDIMDSNLVVSDSKLRGVLDFSGVGVGDPAVDYMVAWELFNDETRLTFAEATGVDQKTWTRAKGWALSTALVALPYYLDTNPAMVKTSKTKIDNLIADTNK